MSRWHHLQLHMTELPCDSNKDTETLTAVNQEVSRRVNKFINYIEFLSKLRFPTNDLLLLVSDEICILYARIEILCIHYLTLGGGFSIACS